MALPMVVVSSQIVGDDFYISPNKLPSSGFKYYKWHELEDNVISSSELKYPRVRKAPESLKVENCEELVKYRKENDVEMGKVPDPAKQNYKNDHENWKECKVVNLSYQDLGDKYQTSSFKAILKKLGNCVQINISHNELSQLGGISFSSCQVLNMMNNHLKSFKELPSIRHAVQVNLDENNISSFAGIEKLKSVTSLSLLRNPIQYSIDYRKSVFKKLPKLKVLDGIPKLAEDV